MDARKYTPSTSKGMNLSGLGFCLKKISSNGIIEKIKKKTDWSTTNEKVSSIGTVIKINETKIQ